MTELSWTRRRKTSNRDWRALYEGSPLPEPRQVFILARDMAEARLIAQIRDIARPWRLLAYPEDLRGCSRPLVYKTLCWSRPKPSPAREINAMDMNQYLRIQEAEIVHVDCPYHHKDGD